MMASSKSKLELNDADIWDSGKVQSDNSVAVKYSGIPLQPLKVYYWKVKVWDNHDVESPFSDIKAFMTNSDLDGGTSRYPLQITDEVPTEVSSIGKKCTFIDFGKAAFGKLKVTLTSEHGKDTVTIRLGEHKRNGRVDRKPEATIRYTEYRLPLFAGVHTYTIKFRPDKRNTKRQQNESKVDPIFMPDYIGEVYPFRYCEIDNYSYKLAEKDAVRQNVHYFFNDFASSFHSSDSILNQVWHLCKYSIKATSFCGIYVDGDRERIAYEADALINQLGHYYVDREFSMARHTHEHLLHNSTWPTEWHLQSILIAWNDYMYTGNKASLEQHYTLLKAKTLLALKESNGLISTWTQKNRKEFHQTINFRGDSIRDIVDWPQKGYVGGEKKEAGEADGYEMTRYNTVVNAFYYEALRLMSLIAEALGEVSDREYYSMEAGKVKIQFNRLFFDKKRGCYKDGLDTEHCSLHANMFPLAFGMVEEKYTESVVDFIMSRRMACSVYGSQFLLDALYNAYKDEYGLQLLASTNERSWYNMIRMGSTITSEAWDNKYKPNQDWNHAWGATPANLIPRKIFGIEPIEAGSRKIRIKPQPGFLREASIVVPTIRGNIKVSFENVPQKSYLMKVTIPANSEAEVWVPVLGRKYQLYVDGIKRRKEIFGQFMKLTMGSGVHMIEVK